jgi:hypothetical protein
MAVASGVVVLASRNGGSGNMVTIDHGNGYVTRYGHNNDLTVVVGERVEKGDVIAHMGSTGRATGTPTSILRSCVMTALLTRRSSYAGAASSLLQAIF